MKQLLPTEFAVDGVFGTALGGTDVSIETADNTTSKYGVFLKNPTDRFRVYDRVKVSYAAPAIADMTIGSSIYLAPDFNGSRAITVSQVANATLQVFPIVGGVSCLAGGSPIVAINKLFIWKNGRLKISYNSAAAGLTAGQAFQIRGSYFESADPDEIMCIYRQL